MRDPDPAPNERVPLPDRDACTLGAAHDLNGLLTIILGRAALLARTVPDPDCRRQLEAIEAAARDAAVILRRILAESGHGDWASAATVSLAATVEQCWDWACSLRAGTPPEGGERCELTTQIPPELALLVAPAALREVLLNLFRNALEAMPHGGELQVSAAREGPMVRLRVQDHGIGMDGQTLESLFKWGFSRGKPGGRGLGLSVTHDLVAAMGGNIDVQSALGRGTTFQILLPAAPEQRHETARHPGQSPAKEGPGSLQRILVVDNEVEIRALMAEVLAAAGHRVVTQADGQEAWRRYRPGDFDVVLADLKMPGLSGLELCRRIRRRDPNVAIVLISGWGGEAAATEAGEGVVDFFAAKPLDVETIGDLVTRAAAVAMQRRRSCDRAET
jgi:two-component system cell cycle sensor histidine kinase/response regulator CckA